VPKFKVVPEGDKFQIEDEKGNTYGLCDTKKEAEDKAALWAEYYAASLIF
jgi:hypothetical protein